MGNAPNDGAKNGGAKRAEGSAAAGKESLAARAPGRVMASLLLTPDDELPGFRRACLGKDSQADSGNLVMARKILQAIGRALAEDDPGQWERLRAAWRALAPEEAVSPPAKPSEPRPWLATGLPRTPQAAIPERPEMLAPISSDRERALGAPVTRTGLPEAVRPGGLPPELGRWAEALAAPAPIDPPRMAVSTVVDEGPRLAGAGSALPDGALPFAKSDDRAAVPPPVARARPEVLALSGLSEETLPAASLTAAERAKLDALPFDAGARAPKASGSSPAQPAAPVTDEGGLGSTTLGRASALPLALGAAQPRVQAARPAHQVPLESDFDDRYDRTVALNSEAHRSAALGAAGALPFGARAPVVPGPGSSPAEQPAPGDEWGELPTAAVGARSDVFTRLLVMSLEQYASLCAECALFPEHVQQIERRHGVSSQVERTALDRLWRYRMAEDPTLRARWTERYGALMQLLKNHPPR